MCDIDFEKVQGRAWKVSRTSANEEAAVRGTPLIKKKLIRCSQIIKSNKVKFFNKIWLKGFNSFQYFRLNVMKIQFFFCCVSCVSN